MATPRGMPSYTAFVQGVTRALDHVRHHPDGNVLGTPPESTIELNLRIRNSAVTEFTFNPKRHALLTFNTLPHLDHADYAGWITSA